MLSPSGAVGRGERVPARPVVTTACSSRQGRRDDDGLRLGWCELRCSYGDAPWRAGNDTNRPEGCWPRLAISAVQNYTGADGQLTCPCCTVRSAHLGE